MKEQFLNLSGLIDLVTYMKLCIAQHKVIIPRASFSLFPETGDENNIYIDTSTNAIYRWNDTDKKFVLLAKPPRTIAISEGTNNGEITLKVDNIASNAKVHGLTSTAFTESNKFATAAQGAKADSAVQTITLSSGTKNGTIKIKVNNITTDNIEVAGLGSAAFSDIGIFAAKSHTHKKDEVGLGNVDNTADINKSVKYATSAGSIDWSGIKNKPSVYPPPQDFYDDRFYTKSQVDSKLSSKSDTGHTHVQFIQETKFSNGTYTDPLNGTTMAIKASGGIAADLIYEGGTTLSSKYQAKGSYASNTHTHDDRYYTETEMNSKLAGKAEKSHTHSKSEVGLGNVDNTADANKSVKYAGSSGSSNSIVYTALTNTNLNTLQTEGKWYYAGGGNTCTNIPIESAAFELYVGRNASGWRYQQFTVTSGEIYIRVFDSSNWGNWRKLAFTSDTVASASSVPWSGISGKPSTFPPSSHSHTKSQITDFPGALKNPNSLKIQLNGGTTEGTNQFTYDGSAAKTINITPSSIGAAASSHTHSYAGSASTGGSATSAVKLDTTTAGSSTQPVYFTGGKPVACTYTLGKSVPSNAVFTDTNTWRGIQNNLTSDSTSDSLSAAQGKVLKGLVDGKAASSHTHTIAQISNLQSTLDGKANNHSHPYLPLSGGTMTGTAFISWADTGNWTNNNNNVTFPVLRGGLKWSGQSDGIELYAVETGNDNLELYLKFLDDNSNGLSIRNSKNEQTARISSTGTITATSFIGSLSGNASSASSVPWSGVTGKPSSMPASDVYPWAKASTKPSYSKSEVGLGNVDNTADSAKSVKYATSAGSATNATYLNIVAGNEFRFNKPSRTEKQQLWFGYAWSDGSKSDLISTYCFGNGNGGYAQVTASQFNGSLNGNASTASSAAKWTTARTLSLTGSVTGSATIDGSGNVSLATTTNHTHAYLPLSGGTLTGALTFANSTWNTVGDDVAIGDMDIGGTLGIMGKNGNTSIKLVVKGASNTKGESSPGVAWTCTADGQSTMSGTLSGTFSGSLSGNASSASSVPWSGVSGKPSTYTPSSHTHTKSQITDFPSSIKNPTSLSIQLNGGTATTYDGSSAKSINITPSSIGSYKVYRGDFNQHETYYCLGTAYLTQSGSYLLIKVASGNGYNSNVSQDLQYEIHLRTGNNSPSGYAGYVEYHTSILDNNVYVVEKSSTEYQIWIGKTIFTGKSFFTVEVPDDNKWVNSGATQTTVPTNAKKLAQMQIAHRSDIPTTLPASDVYAWAKASSKPSYSWNEITNKPSTFTPSAHTHNYAGSSSAGGAANYVAANPASVTYEAYRHVWFSDSGTETARCYNDSFKYDPKSNKLTVNITGSANSVPWSGVTGKPSTFTPSSHTHTKSQITDFPTSMPASDVYAWAKASSKPSYSWSEIGSKPSTFTPSSHTHSDKLGAVSANGFYGMARPDGNTSDWIRTTSNGIIPYQSGGAGSGHCGIGTSSWYFSTAYIDNITCVNANTTNVYSTNTVRVSKSNLTEANVEVINSSCDIRLAAAASERAGIYDVKSGKWIMYVYKSYGKANFDNHVQMVGVYNNTSSNAANVRIASDGDLLRSTSASKYKLDIQDINRPDSYYYNILKLKPRQWFDKAEVENYSKYLTDLYNDELDRENIDYREDTLEVNPIYGLIAEDVEAAGLPEFCDYSKIDEDGNKEIEGIQYDRLPVLMIPILRDLVTCMQKILPSVEENISDENLLSEVKEIQSRFNSFNPQDIVNKTYSN